MMVTTHVFAALTIAAPLAYVAPEFASILAIGAVLGGITPDLDVVFDHRRTLHFPVAGFPLAVGTILLAVLLPTSVTIGVAVFVVAAWLHAVSDVLGSGPELEPWRDPSNRAVYDHIRGRWIGPRRLVRYDGAPEDAVLATVLALPALFVFDGWVQGIVIGGIVLSIGYALVRRRLVEWIPECLQ